MTASLSKVLKIKHLNSTIIMSSRSKNQLITRRKLVIFMRNRNRLMVTRTYIFSDHRSSHFETNRLKTFQLGSFVKRNFFIRLKFPSRLYPSIFWKLFQIFTRRQFIIKYISPWWNFTPNILFSFTLKIESVWNYMRIEGLEKLQKFDVAVKKKQKKQCLSICFLLPEV